MRTSLFFSTPVASITDDPALLTASERIADSVQQWSEEHAGVARSNSGGWHSPILRGHSLWAIPQIQAVVAAVHQTICRLDPTFTADPFIEHCHGWANISPAGASNRRHSHPGAVWCAVFYPRVPEGSAAPLVLHDPKQITVLGSHPDNKLPAVKLTPKTAMLVVFPGYVPHSVDKHQGEQSRMSVVLDVFASPLPPRQERT